MRYTGGLGKGTTVYDCENFCGVRNMGIILNVQILYIGNLK